MVNGVVMRYGKAERQLKLDNLPLADRTKIDVRLLGWAKTIQSYGIFFQSC